MMPPKVVFFFLAILPFSNWVWGAENYKVGDTLYVWARSGLNIRTEASVRGKKLGKLEAGEALMVIETTNRAYQVRAIDSVEEDGTPLILTGTWIKVKAGQFEGYVIDTYLLKYPPNLKGGLSGFMQSFQSEPIEEVLEYYEGCESGDSTDCYSVNAVAKNGMVYSLESYYVGTDESLTIPGLTVEEGFVLLNFFFPLEDANLRKKGYSTLAVMSNSDNEIWLSGEEGMCEYSISVQENGMILVFHGCSC
jgi:hypothetical protein